MLSSVARPTGLSRGGSPFAQRCERRPLTCRRFEDDRAGHARAGQYTLGHIIDMNAHWDPLSEPDPLESWIGIDEEFGAVGIVAIGDAAGDALHMPAQCGAAVRDGAENHSGGRADRFWLLLRDV